LLDGKAYGYHRRRHEDGRGAAIRFVADARVGLIDRGEEPVRGVEAEIESAKLRHLPSAGRTPMRWAVDGD
jgi:hypothetical protein